MFRFFTAVVVSGFLAMPFSSSAFAQSADGSPSVSATALSAEGVVVGRRVVVDDKFAQEHNIAVAVPFAFTVPTDGGGATADVPAPGGDAIIKVYFATSADEDRQLKSSIILVPLTVPMGPADDRLAQLQELAKQVFTVSIPDLDKADLAGMRKTMVGPYPALEAVGKYLGAGEDGLVIRRAVLIPDPKSNNGLIAVIDALVKTTGMQGYEDIMKVDASRALGTLRFQ